MRSEIKRFGRGFVYAWNGIRAAVQEERNFRFHLCAACYAVILGMLADLSCMEWALLAFCITAVLGMELMNSAVERAVDKPDTTHWWSAGAAKDMAAGAVLIVALGALAVGGCLFLPAAECDWKCAAPGALDWRGLCSGLDPGVFLYFPLSSCNTER